ncbi:hypothetical protein LVJ94_17785 [Pendulispora rubella]|uniref:Lipoprotein n=1 Tax=Pendulispora rubella TaxID=2741070 RepID=A0ABZ2LJS2_9BACT
MKSSFFSLAPRMAKASYAVGFLALSLSALGAVASGCSSDDNNNGGTTPPRPDAGNGNDGGGTKPTVELIGEVTTNTTLTADKFWLLKGVVFVRNGATLTIEKGTTIKGENASKGILVIQPGGKIMAEGTANEPILFTSQLPEGARKAGDWGGVIILGNARVNRGVHRVDGLDQGGTFGGQNDDESSGTFRYVRIEYSGIELSPDNEVNGLTMAGVGRGTTIDHVQIRHTKDDCFEFFGGTVNAKYLACQYNQDDGIDWDLGWTGKLQFFVLQQDPNTGEEMNGFEADNDNPANSNEPVSEPTIYNVTLCGQNSDQPKAQFGMLLRRNTKGHIFNTLAMGFESGIDIRDVVTGTNATAGSLEVKSSLFFGSTNRGVVDGIAYPETGSVAPDKDNDGNVDELNWFKTGTFKNSWSDPGISGCFNAAAPSFGPATSLTTNAATPPNDGFFDPNATYIGAFKDANDNWATTGNWIQWKAN